MAEINDDMSKFSRVRDSSHLSPYTKVSRRAAKNPDEKASEKPPLVQADNVSVSGRAPVKAESEELAPEKMAAFVDELKAMPDVRDERIDEVLNHLEEDGYDPETVLPKLIDRLIEEEF